MAAMALARGSAQPPLSGQLLPPEPHSSSSSSSSSSPSGVRGATASAPGAIVSTAGVGAAMSAAVASKSSASRSAARQSGVEVMEMVGSKVLYWSRTRKIWTPALVNSVVYTPDGKLQAYNLDVKPGVAAARVRMLTSTDQARNGAVTQATSSRQHKHTSHSDDAERVKSRKAKGEFLFGEHVKFWSESHTKWIDTYVTGVNRSATGEVASYNLTAKSKADKSRVRASSTSADAPPPRYWQGTPLVADTAAQHESRIQGSSNGQAAPFVVGEQVQYHSATKGSWVETVVEAVRMSSRGVTYDVSCKKGVKADRVRATPGRFEIGEVVEYFSQTENRWVRTRLLKINWKTCQCSLSVKANATISRIRKAKSTATGMADAVYPQQEEACAEEIPVPLAKDVDMPSADVLDCDLEPTSQAFDSGQEVDETGVQGKEEVRRDVDSEGTEDVGEDVERVQAVIRQAELAARAARNSDKDEPGESLGLRREAERLEQRKNHKNQEEENLGAKYARPKGTRAKQGAKPKVTRTEDEASRAKLTDVTIWNALEQADRRATARTSPAKAAEVAADPMSKDPSKARDSEKDLSEDDEGGTGKKNQKKKRKRESRGDDKDRRHVTLASRSQDRQRRRRRTRSREREDAAENRGSRAQSRNDDDANGRASHRSRRARSESLSQNRKRPKRRHRSRSAHHSPDRSSRGEIHLRSSKDVASERRKDRDEVERWRGGMRAF